MKEVIGIIAKVLVLIGALNWLSVGAFNTNLVQASFLKKIDNTIYILVGLSALYLIWQRDFYLPFLGRCVLPPSACPEVVPKSATVEAKVRVEPGKKVLYWAAEKSPEGTWDTHKQAYGDYTNVGVTTANALGEAVLRVREPSGYKVPITRRTLSPHIHYRIADENPAMWGPVKTVEV